MTISDRIERPGGLILGPPYVSESFPLAPRTVPPLLSPRRRAVRPSQVRGSTNQGCERKKQG